MKKRKQRLVQIKCEYCSVIFTGEAWRTYCLDCYKERKRQSDIEKGEDLSFKDKECLSCKNIFSGQYWAKVCPKCYYKSKNPEKLADKECVVCNASFKGQNWRTHCRDCWVEEQANSVYTRQQDRD